MRKKRLAIKLLLLPFVSLLLSSCAAGNAGKYSYGDRDSFSYRPVSSEPIETNEYANGRRVFDAFYDYQNYATNHLNRTTYNVSSFPSLEFVMGKNELYSVNLIADGKNVTVNNIGAIYIADINFDGHDDLCLGLRVTLEQDYYVALAYDIFNKKELLNLDEKGNAQTGGHDYAFNYNEKKVLMVESSYSVNPISLNSRGYFKTNTNSEVNLDWKPIQFEIVDLETEVNNIPTFKGTDGIERYIVNTKDVYNNIYLIINFFGDFLTSTYGENDVSFSQSVGFALSITERFIDKLALSITFNTEGRYNITCNVANYHTTLFFEANDELYEMLQVA